MCNKYEALCLIALEAEQNLMCTGLIQQNYSQIY
jgi:hypothetical protein